MEPTDPPAGDFPVLQAQRLGIARFLLEAVHETEAIARQRNVELRCAWESDIGCVQVDELKMHHLLCILLLRAVERAAPSGIVLLSAELLGDRVRISITDAGPPDEAEPDPRSEGYPPWSVMEDTLVAHGGELWVDREPGERATCCFTLLAALQTNA